MVTVRGVSHTHTHSFNGHFSGTTQIRRYQKGKTNLDFTEARDSEWQWHQLGHMQVCISLQTDNHASTPLLSFLQARCPSCRPTNSVKALKALSVESVMNKKRICCSGKDLWKKDGFKPGLQGGGYLWMMRVVSRWKKCQS